MSAEDDLATTTTEGYKVGEKKTIDEYKNLDQNDESLNKWKASLGLGSGTPLPVAEGDARKCVIVELALEASGRPDIVVDLSQQEAIDTLKKHPFKIKEGCEFRMRAKFRVQHDVLSGLKYVHVVKRKGIKIDKHEEMLGSYAPNTTDIPVYEKKFKPDEAPSGMLARGNYVAQSRFTDDDGHNHLEYEWAFEIAKEW